MILILFFLLILSTYFAVRKPTYFILFYILAQSKFLGFLDLTKILIEGNDIAFPILNIIALLLSLRQFFYITLSKIELLLILFITYLYFYGILLPLVLDYSTFMQAFMSSKTYMFYSFLFYLIAHKSVIDIKKILQFLFLISYYLVVIKIFYITTSFSPPEYIETYFKSSEEYQRIYFPTYIALAILINIYYYITKSISKIKFFLSTSFLLIGILFSEYTSLLLTSIGIILFTLFYFNNKIKILKGTILTILSISTFFIFISFNDTLKNSVMTEIENKILGNTIELISRDYYNKFRWKAINDEPYFGFGFIHKNATILNKYNNDVNNKFMESFNVIDSGYVDLLVKFGYINTFLFFILFIYIATQIKNKYMKYIYVLMLLQYGFINYTWAVFMYQHGIIPLAIMFHFALNNHKRNLVEG